MQPAALRSFLSHMQTNHRKIIKTHKNTKNGWSIRISLNTSSLFSSIPTFSLSRHGRYSTPLIPNSLALLHGTNPSFQPSLSPPQFNLVPSHSPQLQWLLQQLQSTSTTAIHLAPAPATTPVSKSTLHGPSAPSTKCWPATIPDCLVAMPHAFSLFPVSNSPTSPTVRYRDGLYMSTTLATSSASPSLV